MSSTGFKFNFNFGKNNTTQSTQSTQNTQNAKDDKSAQNTKDDKSAQNTKDDKSAQNTKDEKKPMKIDFQGLKFDTSNKPTKKDTSIKKGFNFQSGASGNSAYDAFLKSRISSGKNSSNQKKNTSSNPPQLTKKKENQFEVHYVPISGVHLNQIFIQKEVIPETTEDQVIGFSFNQPTHISQTFDTLYE